MVIAALLSFAILLLAWILAPNGVRTTVESGVSAWELEAQASY